MFNIWGSWNFANVDPKVESLLQKLKLKIEQYLRKLFREIDMLNFSTLGIIASSIERFATK